MRREKELMRKEGETKEIKYKPWSEIDKNIWQYSSSKLPIGQKWGVSSAFGSGCFVTNHQGEGFTLHKGTKPEEIENLINSLNWRDVEIALRDKMIETLKEEINHLKGGEKMRREKENSWKKIDFTSEEILRRKHILDLPDDGYFIVEEAKIDAERKALLLVGVHQINGEEKKAELWAYLEGDEEELKEVETAGEALLFGWEDYTIDYIEKGEGK